MMLNKIQKELDRTAQEVRQLDDHVSTMQRSASKDRLPELRNELKKMSFTINKNDRLEKLEHKVKNIETSLNLVQGSSVQWRSVKDTTAILKNEIQQMAQSLRVRIDKRLDQKFQDDLRQRDKGIYGQNRTSRNSPTNLSPINSEHVLSGDLMIASTFDAGKELESTKRRLTKLEYDMLGFHAIMKNPHYRPVCYDCKTHAAASPMHFF